MSLETPANLLHHYFPDWDKSVLRARRKLGFSSNTDLYYAAAEAVEGPDGTLLLTEKLRSFLAEQQPRDPFFKGKVFVLINGGSFSTTTDTCTAIDQHTDAVFIGKEAGGSYYGNTSGQALTITLPHTKARARVPLERYYDAASGYEPTNRGLVPDHAVSPEVGDLTEGTDAVLAYTFDLIRTVSEAAASQASKQSR